MGPLTFPPFIGHFQCFLAMAAAVRREAACVWVRRQLIRGRAQRDAIGEAWELALLTAHVLGFPGPEDREWNGKARASGFSKGPQSGCGAREDEGGERAPEKREGPGCDHGTVYSLNTYCNSHV